jgi:hypothetical protein
MRRIVDRTIAIIVDGIAACLRNRLVRLGTCERAVRAGECAICARSLFAWDSTSRAAARIAVVDHAIAVVIDVVADLGSGLDRLRAREVPV